MDNLVASNMLKSALGIGGPAVVAQGGGVPDGARAHPHQPAELAYSAAAGGGAPQYGSMAAPRRPFPPPGLAPHAHAQALQPTQQPPAGYAAAPQCAPSTADAAALVHSIGQLAQLQAQIVSAHGALQTAAQQQPPATAQQRAMLEMRAAELVQRHTHVTQQLAAHRHAHQQLLHELQQQPQQQQQQPATAAGGSPQAFARGAQTRPQPRGAAPQPGAAGSPGGGAWSRPSAAPPTPPLSSASAVASLGLFAPPAPGTDAARPSADAPYADQLTFQIAELHASRLPPAEDDRWRRAVVETVNRIASRLWRGAHVRVFGSSASGLHTRGADLDLCLIPPRPPHINAARRMIVSIGAELEQQGMLEVLPLPSARVPIVKFVDRASRIHCDICVNNQLALANTGLLGAYARLDGRVRPLVAAVKFWAAQRKVNEPFRGTLSSYAYVLLVLHFLQTTSPPVLPCLQQLGRADGDERIVDGYDVWYCEDPAGAGWRGSANTQSTGELLLGFFLRYALEFDESAQVVSVRLGKFLERSAKVWGESQTAAARKGRKADRHLFSIEDPFELSHDLGRVMDANSLGWTREELTRAHALLSRGAPLSELCAPWSEEEEGRAPADTGVGAGAEGEEDERPRGPDERAAAGDAHAASRAQAEAAAAEAEAEAAVAKLSEGLAAAALGDTVLREGAAHGGESDEELEPDESSVQLPSGLF